MAKPKLQLVIDTGNTNTRVGVKLSGETSVRETSFELPNTFATIPDEEQVKAVISSGDYNNITSSVYFVDLPHIHRKLRGVVASGEIAETNYSKFLRHPLTTRAKYESNLVYMAIIKAIDHTLEWATQFSKSGKTKSGIANSFDIDLTLLVPPIQATKAQEVYPKALMGIQGDGLKRPIRYRDLISGEDMAVTINSVNVLPEGLTAYFAITASYEKRAPRPEYADLAQRRVILLDIGGGTSDIVALNKGQLMASTQHTIRVGGNDIVTRTRVKFNTQNETNLSEEFFSNVASDPVIHVGDSTYDVSDLVGIAKDEVVQNIVSEIQDFFVSQNIDLNSFERLLIVGGGALAGESGESISELILDDIQDFIPEITLVDTSKVKEPSIGEDGLDFSSPRNFNLLGGMIVASLKSGK